MNDYAGLLARAERERLEANLAERERATGAQMAIAIFRALEGESLEDVADRLFQQWRLGRKGLDNGVLLVVFVNDRKLRLEVGYGLEAAIPDAAAGGIIREAITPRFRERRWAAGLEAAVDAVYARIASPKGDPERLRKEAESWRRAQKASEDSARLYLILFLALFALIVGSLAWEVSRQRHGFTAGRRGWDRTSGGWSGWSGGGWSGGGGSSGGGGFSGGGGSSGGGGASGSW
ncbi:MAG: TPM domain-containing protein [Candidatus Rokubacteria bacterium]|nr:TPM domain-containing protein [Candidatus Rokubacteria bacterium]